MTAEPPADFAARFADAWREPSPERLVALLTDDVVLYQPTARPIRGRDRARAEFERLFGWIPGLHGEEFRGATRGELAMIEWVMCGPLGGDELRMPIVDTFVLRGGLGAERRAYFDPTHLFRHVAARPSAWAGLVRFQLGR